MTLEELKETAIKTYAEYGEAIKKAFNFDSSSYLPLTPLENVLQTDNEGIIKSYIRELKQEISRCEETA